MSDDLPAVRPVLPRLGVPRRADLEDLHQAIRRSADKHECSWLEAFHVIQAAAPLAMQKGVHFYCGYGPDIGAPVTLLSNEQFFERLKEIEKCLYEDSRFPPPPTLATRADLDLLTEIAFDPSAPTPTKIQSNSKQPPWAHDFPVWALRNHIDPEQAALLLAGIDPAKVQHSIKCARNGNWTGWNDAEAWCEAIIDQIRSGLLKADDERGIAVCDLCNWLEGVSTPATEPDPIDFWIESPDPIAESRAEAAQAIQERDKARAMADALARENAALKEELSSMRKRLAETEQQRAASNFSDVLDSGNPCHPPELEAALIAWKEVFRNGKPIGIAPKEAIIKWLTKNRQTLSSSAKDRIATVANPYKEGGAPKTL